MRKDRLHITEIVSVQQESISASRIGYLSIAIPIFIVWTLLADDKIDDRLCVPFYIGLISVSICLFHIVGILLEMLTVNGKGLDQCGLIWSLRVGNQQLTNINQSISREGVRVGNLFSPAWFCIQ